MYKRLAVLCLVALMTACSPQHTEESPEKQVIIASEKTIPANIEDVWTEGTGESYNAYYARKAENVEQFQEFRNIFRMKGESPEVDFANHDAYFISFYESSSCPKEPKDVKVEGLTLSFTLVEDRGKDGICTDDLSPRTLILELDSSEVDNLLIREKDSETQISLE